MFLQEGEILDTETPTYRAEGHVKTEAETGGTQLQDKEHQELLQLLEARRGKKGFFPRAEVPNFFGPWMGSVEDSFSIDWIGAEGWFRVDTNALYFLCTFFLLLLYQLHLR